MPNGRWWNKTVREDGNRRQVDTSNDINLGPQPRTYTRLRPSNDTGLTFDDVNFSPPFPDTGIIPHRYYSKKPQTIMLASGAPQANEAMDVPSFSYGDPRLLQ